MNLKAIKKPIIKPDDYQICVRCDTRPVRRRGSFGTEQLWFCMECARTEGKLQVGDYEPEPEGFPEFVAVVERGALFLDTKPSNPLEHWE